MANSHKAVKVGMARKTKLETQPNRSTYPFSGIVSQNEMKLALVLNVIASSIGGVLIMGHRGTGKSTVVRALADLLPEISVVPGCVYRCDPADAHGLCDQCGEVSRSQTKLRRETSPVPVVDLPLGATEDRVCGTIDIEHALRNGARRFEPGLLARANRGFLYIDEVNLLEDHLVDLLLDVAATGVNKVERESISVEHPARFVLIGSGNPEEGELRPQLLDRFGVFVEVKTEEDLDRRVEIMERREAFERNPEAFCIQFADEQEQLRRKIARARRSLPNIKVERLLLKSIAQVCSELRVDGHRGELTIIRAARALAALEGRKKITEAEVRRVAVMCLRHRLRRDALEETAGAERIEQALDGVFGESGAGAPQDGRSGDDSSRDDSSGDDSSIVGVSKRQPSLSRDSGERSPATVQNGRLNAGPNGSHGADAPGQDSGPTGEVELPKLRSDKGVSSTPSRASSQLQRSRKTAGKSIYGYERGRYAGSVSSKTTSTKLALDATLRAAAGLGFRARNIEHDDGLATSRAIPASALRFKRFKRKQGRLFIFAIDLSGSMALNRLGKAKGVILALLRESYIKRDSVAIVGFRGTTADLLLPPSRSILRARRVLDSVSVGGGTPLSAGLACALDLSKRVGSRGGEIFLLVFTDGQANVPLRPRHTIDRAERQRQIEVEIARLGSGLKKSAVTTTVISTLDRYRSNDAAERIAVKLNARCLSTFV